MGELHRTLLEEHFGDGDIVARASGQTKKDKRWTVLTLYKPAAYRADNRFVAEIVGETLIEGEERRVRRAAFTTLARALNWGAFNARSALYNELRAKALDWIEAQARDVSAGGDGSGLVPVYRYGTVVDERPLPTPHVLETWEGEDRNFRSALCWLYAPLHVPLEEAIALFAKDWGRPVSHVRAAINLSGLHTLPGWADTFCMCMRHFKRESFLAVHHR